MLPTGGYFNNVLCPYFVSGLCERPHCHFRHAAAVPTYVPTPLYKTVSSREESAKRKSSAKSNSVPEYKPTPIAELRKLKANREEDISQAFVSAAKEEKGAKSEEKEEVKEAEAVVSNDVESIVEIEDKTKIAVDEGAVEDKKTYMTDESDVECPDDDIEVCEPEKAKLIHGRRQRQDVSKSECEVLSISRSASAEASGDDGFVVPTKKARVAHKQSEISKSNALLVSKKSKLSPVEVMYNRIKSSTSVNAPPMTTSQTTGKKRIAHNLKSGLTYSKSSSATKGNEDEEVKRPIFPLGLGGKVPIVIRQRYLNLIIDECLKCCPEPKDAYKRGLEEEKSVFIRSSNKTIYANFAVHLIKRLRNESKPAEKKEDKSKALNKAGNRVISHEAILNGPQAAGCSIEKRSSISIEDLSDPMLFKIMQRFVLTKEQLKQYGYPLLNPEKEDEVIYPFPENKRKNNFLSSRRTCSRCAVVYQVNEDGVPVKRDHCVFHFGRLWNERLNGSVERRYSCCKGDASSDGCCSAKSHVADGYGHPDLLKGYVSTKPPTQEGFHGIYAIDCEMCYTTIGLELTRVSVIDHKCKSVYESLVKPKNPILDYNTKFSGINEGDLDSVKTTLQDVQKRLLKFVNSETMLIGHSLDSDFKALKLLHETVIDTVAVFPHNRGLPYRRALKTITAECLKKIIQDEVGGHDSQEDAVSCMQLVLWKVGQELSKLKKVA